MKTIIFANSYYNLGGGEKIFVEYAKNWHDSKEEIQVITNEKGRRFCLDHGLKKRVITVWPASWSDKYGIFLSSVYKSFLSLFRAFSIPIADVDNVFSASFIWPDLFPGLVMKLKNPKIRWVVASYLFATPPWAKHYDGNHIRSFILYAVQMLALFITDKFADVVFTASQYDAQRFNKKYSGLKAIPVRGGVNFSFFKDYPKQKKEYDAVFVGRLHPQKNVDELIDIWKEVVERSPNKKLAIIGEGYLENELKDKVKRENLKKNVRFLGKLDGLKKVRVLKSSKIFLSSSRFDSGNIALDEALACGVPGVTYNIPHLNYTAGVLQVNIGDKKAFVSAITILLESEKVYARFSKEGIKFASTLDWNITSKKALRGIQSSSIESSILPTFARDLLKL